ncbi:hypothetical protein C0J26_01850 [Pseudomonas baetica]|nr:hypothetical protein C0J26_01850 [Pseudomonas baetica]
MVFRKTGSARSQVIVHSCGARRTQCGSGLAREGVVSVTLYFNDPPHSRASPLPQGMSGARLLCVKPHPPRHHPHHQPSSPVP